MTSTTSSEEVVLKTDVLGRIQIPVERRQRLLEEFDRSGLSGAKFAALSGVKYSTFAYWLQRRRRGQKSDAPKAAADSMRWLETVIEQAQEPAEKIEGALILRLPGGAQAQVESAGQAVLAAALLRALEQPAVAC